MDAITITNAIKTVSDIVMSDSGQKFLCGTYSNGEPRSVVDAMRDEYVSPDDRANWDKKKNVLFISEIMYMPDYVENTDMCIH